MIGRASQGNPWLFKQINHYINFGEVLENPSISVIYNIIVVHLEKLYSFYGDATGVRIARKHIGWYFKSLGFIDQEVKTRINQASQPEQQMLLVKSAFIL
jgi:tRNA-dihydrouridine synthase B